MLKGMVFPFHLPSENRLRGSEISSNPMRWLKETNLKKETDLNWRFATPTFGGFWERSICKFKSHGRYNFE